jgi:hypothetical protein
MKVRALQNTYIDGIYREGPEVRDDGTAVKPGVEFEVSDDFVVHREVLLVVVPPEPPRKVRYYEAPAEPEKPKTGKT